MFKDPKPERKWSVVVPAFLVFLGFGGMASGPTTPTQRDPFYGQQSDAPGQIGGSLNAGETQANEDRVRRNGAEERFIDPNITDIKYSKFLEEEAEAVCVIIRRDYISGERHPGGEKMESLCGIR